MGIMTLEEALAQLANLPNSRDREAVEVLKARGDAALETIGRQQYAIMKIRNAAGATSAYARAIDMLCVEAERRYEALKERNAARAAHLEEIERAEALRRERDDFEGKLAALDDAVEFAIVNERELCAQVADDGLSNVEIAAAIRARR